MANTTIKVFRYNPDTDVAPYYQTYNVQMQENLTVLFILKKIYAEQDVTLAFRENLCFKGGCMQCLMTINEKVKKACSSLVKPGETVLVEPVYKYAVVRDLVVDFGTTATTKDGVFTMSKGVLINKKQSKS
jgi:succinate dehydrogenase / fumarate reductase iron-sulfur subunit